MIAATIAGLLVMPLVVLRRRTLAAYYALDLTTWAFAFLIWRRFPTLSHDQIYLACVAVAVLKLATLSLFLARGRDVRFSAGRAAVLAAIVYGLAIPAMLRTVIDGDEPYYLLVTESIVRDFDLDLANQYRELATSETGRIDLAPQAGDPKGPNGEQYSRHEPFLPLLMVPGYALGGLHGALATIALFGVLLVRSTVRWMEDEGIGEEAIRAVFPLFAFGPPVLFYATRIWPEVPAAFFFVEALRGVREARLKRWLPALLGLVMLKLRFVLVAIGLIAVLVARSRQRRFLSAAAVVIAPLAVLYLITGSATNVHSWRELLPAPLDRYVRGFCGLLADGMSGIAFKAPFYLFGLFALTRWKQAPRGFRDGLLAGALYVLYLLPRLEWFGGWAPPLRYVVFLMPVLALGAAAMWERLSRGAIALVSVATVGLVVHGLAHPWRLFHEANGENPVGEWLSWRYQADVSRLFPSFIRENDIRWYGVAAVVVLVVIGLRRYRYDLAIPLAALALAAGFTVARQPGAHVELEDAHVIKYGGELSPRPYTMMRVAERGGWILQGGQSVSFLARQGTWTLHSITGLGATIELAGQTYPIAISETYGTTRVTIPQDGRVTLRCVSGAVNLDRMTRE